MQFQRLNKDVDSAAAATVAAVVVAAAASAAGKESSTIRWQRLGCLFISFAAVVVVVVVVVDVGFKHFMTFISGDAAPLPTAICMPMRVCMCVRMDLKLNFLSIVIRAYICTCGYVCGAAPFTFQFRFAVLYYFCSRPICQLTFLLFRTQILPERSRTAKPQSSLELRRRRRRR